MTQKQLTLRRIIMASKRIIKINKILCSIKKLDFNLTSEGLDDLEFKYYINTYIHILEIRRNKLEKYNSNLFDAFLGDLNMGEIKEESDKIYILPYKLNHFTEEEIKNENFTFASLQIKDNQYTGNSTFYKLNLKTGELFAYKGMINS